MKSLSRASGVGKGFIRACGFLSELHVIFPCAVPTSLFDVIHRNIHTRLIIYFASKSLLLQQQL